MCYHRLIRRHRPAAAQRLGIGPGQKRKHFRRSINPDDRIAAAGSKDRLTNRQLRISQSINIGGFNLGRLNRCLFGRKDRNGLFNQPQRSRRTGRTDQKPMILHHHHLRHAAIRRLVLCRQRLYLFCRRIPKPHIRNPQRRKFFLCEKFFNFLLPIFGTGRGQHRLRVQMDHTRIQQCMKECLNRRFYGCRLIIFTRQQQPRINPCVPVGLV